VRGPDFYSPRDGARESDKIALFEQWLEAGAKA
jgi:hypothetical protein